MGLLNSIFAFICVVLQLMSLAFVWLFVIEMRMGDASSLFDVYKKNGDFLFWSSVVMEIVLWLTVPGMQRVILTMFIISLIVWLLSAVGLMIFSIGKKVDGLTKRNAMSAVKASVINTITFCIISWLFMVK
ncbi:MULTISPECIES: hypothetical protein [unclassified Butyrivibrio]|uniref:hypothetical protein n=1 Tax=unclassified Butyrivibrio TaxID=2639466 RepID=UPI00047A1561|nr:MULTISPECIES: hypothetical protein [unclassified Butyrivibrio]MBR4358146.1 hypothetical protein [Butyrivibrio sp.]SFU71580.1 hypothetical protein SAMN05216540_10720 [Butyrivibrio sp. M55]